MKFIHTADSQLMEAQYGQSNRGRDFLDAAKQAVDLAVENGVGHILHGGDLMDTNSLRGGLLQQLLELDQHAYDQGVTIWVATGNHDLTDPPFADSLERHSMTSTAGIRCIDNQRLDLGGVSVLGLPFLSPDAFRARLLEEEPADILVAHQSIREFMGFPSEAAACLADFPVGKFQMVLLGDLHIRDYRQSNGMIIGYPGSSELASKSEAFDKSVTLFDFKPGSACPSLAALEYLPLKTRHAVGYRIMNETDLAEVVNKLRALHGRRALVFVSYNPQLTMIRERLRAAIDERHIIMLDEPLAACSAPPLPPVMLTKTLPDGTVVVQQVEVAIAPGTPNDEVAAKLEELEILTPADFLPMLLPDSLELQRLAIELMADPSPAVCLEGWTTKRTAELTPCT